MIVTAIIPALNEEKSIGAVVSGLLAHGVDEVVVVDNGSTDSTPEAARRAGARVVAEMRKGYGWACLAGIQALGQTEIVVFADGDGCDDPSDLPALIQPIAEGTADMVIGSRMRGLADPGALPAHSRLGNWLAAFLLRRMYGQQVTDMGPFRAVKFQSLRSLGMKDTGYGWTVEMQAKAALLGLRVVEVPVRYRRRSTGQSKITGNLCASAVAGWIILKTLFLIRIQFSRGTN
jgi:glycosyltransferase involved in cell wall biosynthesis